jgi:hypothetical protein
MNRKIILMVILACLMGLITNYLTNYLMGGKILPQNVKSIKGKHMYRDHRQRGEQCHDFTEKNDCDGMWTPQGKCYWDWEKNNCTCKKQKVGGEKGELEVCADDCTGFTQQNSCDGMKSPDGNGMCTWNEKLKECKIIKETVAVVRKHYTISCNQYPHNKDQDQVEFLLRQCDLRINDTPVGNTAHRILKQCYNISDPYRSPTYYGCKDLLEGSEIQGYDPEELINKFMKTTGPQEPHHY